MGVDRNDYLIYGWKLPYKLKNTNGEKIDLWNDKYLPYIEGHKGIKHSLIIDGMSGQYVVFGQKISSADQYEGWNFINLDLSNLDSESVKTKFKELFVIELIEEPKLLIFSHYN